MQLIDTGFKTLNASRSYQSLLISAVFLCGFMLSVLTLPTSLHQDTSLISRADTAWVHPSLSPVVHSSQSRVQIRSCWCSWRPCCVYVGVCSHSSYPVKSARGVPPHRCVALVLLSDSVVAAVVSVWSNWCNGFEVYPKANYLSVQLTTMHECECVKGREVVNFLFPVQQKTIGLVKNTCVLKCEMC